MYNVIDLMKAGVTYYFTIYEVAEFLSGRTIN